jgi:hypothetical protein
LRLPDWYSHGWLVAAVIVVTGITLIVALTSMDLVSFLIFLAAMGVLGWAGPRVFRKRHPPGS